MIFCLYLVTPCCGFLTLSGGMFRTLNDARSLLKASLYHACVVPDLNASFGKTK